MNMRRYSHTGYEQNLEEDPRGAIVMWNDVKEMAQRGRELQVRLKLIRQFCTSISKDEPLEHFRDIYDEAQEALKLFKV